ncbi:MAG: hypothetical protein ACI8PZ_007505 [Myxococcota bacterium]|jgi:hypothetical protein
MLANRTQGRRAVGGSLDVADGHLWFRPNAFEAMLGGEAADIALDRIAGVGVEPARWSPLELFSGGLRSRVRVELADGSRELFVVGKPDDVVQLLQAALVPDASSAADDTMATPERPRL